MSEVGTTGWEFPSDVTIDGAFFEGGERPYCALRKTQTINDNTWTTVSWDTEDYDTDSMWTSGSPTLISPTTPGAYFIRVGARRTTQRNDYRLGALRLHGDVGSGRYIARYAERNTETGDTSHAANTVQGFFTTLNLGTCDWSVDYYQDNTANSNSVTVVFYWVAVRVGGIPTSYAHL
jgi:hypothetical protein